MAIRSLMSKLVPATDLGKIYATMGALENLVPIAVSPGFTILYNNSLDSWPGLVIIFNIILLSVLSVKSCHTHDAYIEFR